MELFTELIPKEQQHQNFKVISNSEIYSKERDVLQTWADGFVDRDNKFIEEFQRTFNSSFWELYVFACFKELGFRCDFSYASPDFVVSTSLCDFTAEAVIASNPEGYAPEWEKDLERGKINELDVAVMLELASIRLANSITSKHQKYLSTYGTMEHVKDKPFVICLAPFEQPFSFAQNDNALRRVLYKYDQPLYIDDPETGERYYLGESHIQEAQKITGSSVPFGYFTNDKMSEITAIIFSSTATIGKVRALSDNYDYPILFFARRYNEFDTESKNIAELKKDYKESLLDGLHVCINPYAKFPLDYKLFGGREIAIHHYIPQSESYFVDAPDGFLIERGCITLPPKHLTKKLKVKKSGGKYKIPEIFPWPEGELKEVGGFTGPFTGNYMSHYKGWTIVVCFDTIDRNWGAQALKGSYKTLSQYVKVNSTGKNELIILGEWYSSKEEVFDAIKRMISGKEGK